AAASAYGARNTLSRADALAAERHWVQEDDDYDEPVDEPERRGRSPWTWPLIALILLVLFALVGVVLTQAGILFPQTPASSIATTTSAKPSSTSASPTSSSPSPTSSSATPTQSTPAAINLIPESYLGRPFNQVRSELIGLGLVVTGAEVFDDATPGTVVQIDPAGRVPSGSTITVSYSKGPESVTVPTLQSGASEAAVQQAIESAGLRWAKGDPVDPTTKKEPAGTFVSSEPASGSKVPAGSLVTYHLAKAASAAATPSPTGT
ncbi:PASTA domain-containing protein, partial [Arthrobacter sp. TB 26]|uniref:PASTA domain-containing protein n=1 Tax=Arthrobacter sp. TB 26 TaxID=494420 RepID=UPI000462C624